MATSEAQIDELIDDLVTSFPPKETERSSSWASSSTEDSPGCTFRSAKEDSGERPQISCTRYARSRSSARRRPLVANVIGYGMVAPTLVTHGTTEQKSRFLRPLFTGEEIWCQLFSEPGAGSDVAGLACRAERTATSGS